MKSQKIPCRMGQRVLFIDNESARDKQIFIGKMLHG